VTKTFGFDALCAVASAGLTDVGENYADELVEKHEALSDLNVRWHYLGALQTNKIGRITQHADLICGVSRVKEVQAIGKHKPGASIYVQLDTTGLAQRNGATPAEVAEIVAQARDSGLCVEGLMVVAPPAPDEAKIAFLTAARLADELNLKERSMGMSGDFELALACGSTEIRIGSALFGARNQGQR
jgi:uncharacterized pyridoxal phosphate-containing UPF0001 family protein